MSTAYPHPCNRCGFCCIAMPCPAELQIHGPRPPGGKCPELSFDGDVATCGLIKKFGPHIGEERTKEVLGIGIGCCVKARAVFNGTVLDFAAMPDELKIIATRQARNKTVFNDEHQGQLILWEKKHYRHLSKP